MKLIFYSIHADAISLFHQSSQKGGPDIVYLCYPGDHPEPRTWELAPWRVFLEGRKEGRDGSALQCAHAHTHTSDLTSSEYFNYQGGKQL